MSDKASFDFSFTLPGLIWQTVIDEAHGLMVLEVRDQETHFMDYRLVNLKSYQISEFKVAKADWWTTVHRLVYPILIFETYQDPQDPAKKGILIYDLDRGEVLKEVEQFQLTEVGRDALQGHEPGDQSSMKQVDLAVLGKDLRASGKSEVKYPVYYAPGTTSFRTVFDFLEKEDPGLGCEYFEWEEYIIISYYERLGTKFDRKLLVLKGDREICHEVQDEGMNGFASGAFFLSDNLLVFIKNRNQINGIEL